jgi:hypothetical protein
MKSANSLRPTITRHHRTHPKPVLRRSKSHPTASGGPSLLSKITLKRANSLPPKAQRTNEKKEQKEEEAVSTSDSLAICLFGFGWEKEKVNEKSNEGDNKGRGTGIGSKKLKSLSRMYESEYEEEVRKQAVMSVSRI